ncbi:unnamed protein product, partial [Aphanomyces euteiches]
REAPTMPKLTISLHVVISCLYIVAFASALRSYKRRHVRVVAVHPTTAAAAAARSSESRWNDVFIAGMNLLQIGSQSYQAFVMFNGLTRLGAILSYALLVVVYCFLSPVTLFIHNPRVKTTLVNVEDAVFRVGRWTHCQYILLDPSMANDNAWATEALLTTRMLVPTSIFDLMAKLTMYITTMASLRRATLDLCDGCRVDPSKFASKPPRRQLLKINAFLCGAWGVVLSVYREWLLLLR